MDVPDSEKIPLKSWLLALAAVAVCGPWPAWDPHPVGAVALCAAFAVLARPKGRSWWVWLAPVFAVAVLIWPSADEPGRRALTSQLDAHCRDMLDTGEELAVGPELLRFLGAEGEAVDPAYPFGLLDRAARNSPDRTLYLADDRGRVVAWGGAGRTFPAGVRPLGQRQWGLVWSVGSAQLWLREPLLVDGRLVGTIVIADHSPLTGDRIWGMRAVRGHALELGFSSEAMLIRASNSPGVEIPMRVTTDRSPAGSGMWVVGWLVLAVMALVFEPRVAWLVLAVGSGLLFSAGQPLPGFVVAVAVMLAGAAIGRIAGVLGPSLARSLVIVSVVVAAVAAILGVPSERFDWLPEHLVRPGWGGVWMVALALLIAGWPGLSGESFSLARRMRAAALLAILSLGLSAIRVPVDLERVETQSPGVVLPRGDFRTAGILPIDPTECRLEDLAPVLAHRWRLDVWRTPSSLRLLDEEGFEISRWGDLSPAGGNIRVARRWTFDDSMAYPLELTVATEPWSLLRDWKTGAPLETTRSGRSWFAVMTRSGEVAASLHPDIRGLDAMTAGELFHADGGWVRVAVGDLHRLARVRRHGEWLVAAVSHHASLSDWVVRAAIGSLWFLLGTALVLPPKIRRGHLSTFGGRLRLLVAGGVVIPLAILTLFLHQRIRTQEVRLEQNRSLEALQAARYTAVHLGGGFAVDDELARWLAAGWGGEVALWNGIDLLAASRPDLVYTDDLPQLPLAEAFPSYLTGRYDPMVLKWRNRVVATGPVDLQDLRLLIHLYRSDPVRSGSDLGAVDWLLTGALLSALLALVLTTRVEGRLSNSLRQLVAQSRRLLDGEPVGPLQRPKETDLAEVLDAVRSMNETVQQREHSLRHQEELLRITLKTLEQAVVVLEPDGTERFANPSALELEKEFGALFLERLHEAVEEASVGGTASKTVQPVAGRDLTWRIGVAGVPFPDGARGLVAVVDDVTDLVRADRVRQLNQLARIVAHEVKNPLTPIRLWVQELQTAMGRGDPDLGSLLDEACREISTQVDRLQETANSFSNLVALERWEPEPVDLDEIIDDTLAGLGVLERRGIRIRRESESPVPAVVMGDRHWIRRAVSNLVQNSIDALAGEPGGVELTVRSTDELVTLTIEDTGGGVPDDRLPELFSPHFSTTTAGSGLGLALVHQVVIRCHGRVSAANGEHGLQVRLEFPMTRVDDPKPTISQAG